VPGYSKTLSDLIKEHFPSIVIQDIKVDDFDPNRKLDVPIPQQFSITGGDF